MKSIKLFFAMFLFAIAAADVMANDVVYLNSGSVLEGTLLKNDRDSVVVMLNDGRIYRYKSIDVRDVHSHAEVVKPADPKKREYVDISSRQKGWWCAAGVYGGYSLYIQEPTNMGFAEIDFVNGYRFNEYIKIGVGLGVRYYLGNQSVTQRTKTSPDSWSFPIYADFRGNFISQYSRMYSPYWQLDLGYAINDGFFVSPTIGMRFGGLRNNVLVGISYMGQMLEKSVNSETSSVFTSFLCLRVSYEF